MNLMRLSWCVVFSLALIQADQDNSLLAQCNFPKDYIHLFSFRAVSVLTGYKTMWAHRHVKVPAPKYYIQNNSMLYKLPWEIMKGNLWWRLCFLKAELLCYRLLKLKCACAALFMKTINIVKMKKISIRLRTVSYLGWSKHRPNWDIPQTLWFSIKKC